MENNELTQTLDSLDKRLAALEPIDQRITEIRKEYRDAIRELHERCDGLHTRVGALEAENEDEDQSFGEFVASLFGSDKPEQPVAEPDSQS
jgi:chaperonin cofactor prefoldin